MNNENGISLIISQETIKTAFEEHINSLLKTGQYDNPIKKSIDRLIGYSGDKELIKKIDEKVKNYINEFVDSEQFKAEVGRATAELIAKRAFDTMKK